MKSSPGFAALFEGTPSQPGYTAILQTAQAEMARIDRDTLAAQSQADAATLALIEGDKLFQDAQDAYTVGRHEGGDGQPEQVGGGLQSDAGE